MHPERERIQAAFDLIADGADPVDVATMEGFDFHVVVTASRALRELAMFNTEVTMLERVTRLEHRVAVLEAKALTP